MKIYTKEMIKNEKNKINNVKQKVRCIYTPIIALTMIFCIFMIFQKIILRKENVDFFGFSTYIVLTGSMEPEIKPNDMIIVKSCSQDRIKEGSIINFVPGGKTTTVTHRVVETVVQNGETMYRTKGDNNNSNDDELVKYNQINGIVIFRIGEVGVWITRLLTGTGITFMFLALVLCYNHSSQKEDRRLAREEARKRYNVCKYKKE